MVEGLVISCGFTLLGFLMAFNVKNISEKMLADALSHVRGRREQIRWINPARVVGWFFFLGGIFLLISLISRQV
jgi:hypothetical protein